MYILIVIICIIVLFLWCNSRYKKTMNYMNEYMRIEKFIKEVPQNLVVVNTGSNQAYYGITYNDKRCFNFASGTQSLNYDYKILKHYSDHLATGCYILINVCVLSFGFVDYKDDNANSRYYFFLNKDEIINYTKLKKYIYVNFPILRSWKNFIRIWMPQKNKQHNKPYSFEEDAAKAIDMVNIWKKQFNLIDMKKKDSAIHLNKEFIKTKKILQNMLTYCKENSFKAVLLIMPVSKNLREQISKEFMDTVLYDNIKNIDVPILDYWYDERFADYNLYNNACFLNERGRGYFSEILLNDLKVLNDK